MARYRVMRRDVGGLVDVRHPLKPSESGRFMHGSRKDVLENLRTLGIGLVGVELREVDENDSLVSVEACS